MYSLLFNLLLFDFMSNSVSHLAELPKSNEAILFNRPNNDYLSLKFAKLEQSNHIRRKRYLGLSKRFKLNRRYEECVAPGDTKGHCKHFDFCKINVLKTARNVLHSLCVIEKTFVGICCPDDIALPGYGGSQLIMDLPGGAYDYENTANTSGCGIPAEGRSIYSDGRLYKTASIQEWPWLAALYKPSDIAIDGQQFCGGSVITERHILTAAHCFQGITAQEVKVRLGEYNFGINNETRSSDYNVKSITVHENFVLSTYENDIALVELEKPTSFNTYVWPICLPPTKDFVYEDKMAVVAGWGQQYYGGPVSPVLLQVSIPIWPHDRCVDAFLEGINDNNICAAAYEGGRDSCLGDSGGPLNYQLENGRWVVLGVVSWGIGCAQRGRPGIYTKVSNYLPWIIQNTMAETENN